MRFPPPLVRCEGITRRYGRAPILDRLSLSIREGETVALMGANGSGKTTLLRTVAGLEKPDAGEIWLGPVALSSAPAEIRRYVGLVAHEPLVYGRLTGLENLRFFAAMYDLEECEERMELLLRAMGLWSRRDDPVRSYSRGMVQRLAIARAVLHDPPVLILDEPDTGLDRDGLELLASLVRLLRRGRRAILFTTHDRARAFSWADRVCRLCDGRLHPLAR